MSRSRNIVAMPPSTKVQNSVEFSLRQRLFDTQKLAQMRLQRVMELKDEVARLRELLGNLRGGEEGDDPASPQRIRSPIKSTIRREKFSLGEQGGRIATAVASRRGRSNEAAAQRDIIVTVGAGSRRRGNLTPTRGATSPKGSDKARPMVLKITRDPSPYARTARTSNCSGGDPLGLFHTSFQLAHGKGATNIQRLRPTRRSLVTGTTSANSPERRLGRRSPTRLPLSNPMGEHLSTSASISCRGLHSPTARQRA